MCVRSSKDNTTCYKNTEYSHILKSNKNWINHEVQGKLAVDICGHNSVI